MFVKLYFEFRIYKFIHLNYVLSVTFPKFVIYFFDLYIFL